MSREKRYWRLTPEGYNDRRIQESSLTHWVAPSSNGVITWPGIDLMGLIMGNHAEPWEWNEIMATALGDKWHVGLIAISYYWMDFLFYSAPILVFNFKTPRGCGTYLKKPWGRSISANDIQFWPFGWWDKEMVLMWRSLLRIWSGSRDIRAPQAICSICDKNWVWQYNFPIKASQEL